MTAWTSDELTSIGTADELQIASRRRDGTLGNPRTIWVVRVGDDLYVRSMHGAPAAGSPPPRRATKATSEPAAGKDVTFADADPDLNDQIDAAYRDKYRRYGERIIGGVVNPGARAARSNWYRTEVDPPETSKRGMREWSGAGSGTAAWRSRRSGSAAWASAPASARLWTASRASR
jgi:hypothetical protein